MNKMGEGAILMVRLQYLSDFYHFFPHIFILVCNGRKNTTTKRVYNCKILISSLEKTFFFVLFRPWFEDPF